MTPSCRDRQNKPKRKRTRPTQPQAGGKGRARPWVFNGPETVPRPEHVCVCVWGGGVSMCASHTRFMPGLLGDGGQLCDCSGLWFKLWPWTVVWWAVPLAGLPADGAQNQASPGHLDPPARRTRLLEFGFPQKQSRRQESGEVVYLRCDLRERGVEECDNDRRR